MITRLTAGVRGECWLPAPRSPLPSRSWLGRPTFGRGVIRHARLRAVDSGSGQAARSRILYFISTYSFGDAQATSTTTHFVAIPQPPAKPPSCNDLRRFTGFDPTHPRTATQRIGPDTGPLLVPPVRGAPLRGGYEDTLRLTVQATRLEGPTRADTTASPGTAHVSRTAGQSTLFSRYTWAMKVGAELLELGIHGGPGREGLGRWREVRGQCAAPSGEAVVGASPPLPGHPHGRRAPGSTPIPPAQPQPPQVRPPQPPSRGVKPHLDADLPLSPEAPSGGGRGAPEGGAWQANGLASVQTYGPWMPSGTFRSPIRPTGSLRCGRSTILPAPRRPPPLTAPRLLPVLSGPEGTMSAHRIRARDRWFAVRMSDAQAALQPGCCHHRSDQQAVIPRHNVVTANGFSPIPIPKPDPNPPLSPGRPSRGTLGGEPRMTAKGNPERAPRCSEP